MGTPHARWREMHQSGLLATMLKIRSRPHAGSSDLLIDRIARRVPQRPRRPVLARDHRVTIHPDEPLRGREKDHRVVAAPAVRVLVRKHLAVPQASAFLERQLDVRIGVEDALAPEQLYRVEEVPPRADGRVDLEPVFHARQEVIGAVARSGVHGARALLERDVVAKDSYGVAFVERMAESNPFELLAFEARDRRPERPFHRLADGLRKLLSDDHRAAVYVERRVVDSG